GFERGRKRALRVGLHRSQQRHPVLSRVAEEAALSTQSFESPKPPHESPRYGTRSKPGDLVVGRLDDRFQPRTPNVGGKNEREASVVPERENGVGREILRGERRPQCLAVEVCP